MYVCLGSENTLDMHVCSKKISHNIYIYIYIYVCLGSENTLDVHVYSKNNSKKYTHV